MIFADPPYFLSNGGISIQNGKVVCVDKGEWDKGGTPEYVDSFNRAWIPFIVGEFFGKVKPGNG